MTEPQTITGTIAVTGADGHVGRAVLRQLRAARAHTVALPHFPAGLPAALIIPGPLHAAPAQAALESADVVIHLAGALRPVGDNSYEEAILETAEAVAVAVARGRARRVIALSCVGADEESTNRYLRYKAAAERALTATHKDVIVIRSTYIIGRPEDPGQPAVALLARPGRNADVPGDGCQTVAPVFVDDVASALVAAVTRGTYGTYEMAGPDRMSLDDLVRLLHRGADVTIRHVPAWMARLVSTVLPALPGPMVDVLLRDNIGDPTRACSTFDLRLTSLREVWSPIATQAV
ncbi:MAG: NAD(P)H-binding protein [Armatimonadota bacterium]|nr:NAD(P)H-binding protein [Armatimonadota bacterium]